MSIPSLLNGVQSKLNVLDLEHLKRFNFAIQIDGNNEVNKFLAGFNQVGDLKSQVDVRQVLEGGYRGRHRFPRNAAVNSFRLIRGMSFSRSLWDWHQEVVNWTKGKPSYLRTLSIFCLSQVNVLGQSLRYEVWSWDVYKAWPSEWVGPDLDSGANDIALEGITIEHAGISEAKNIFSGTSGEILSTII